MMNNNRVFITGVSAVTACGLTADDTWNSILSGQSGVDEIRQWDISSWECRIGGELKNFQPAKMLPDRKLIKVISRQDAMGINAAVQAVEDSKIISYRDSLSNPDFFNDKCGVYVGSPGNKYYQQYDFLPLLAKTGGGMESFAHELFNEVHPMWLLRILPNNVLAYTGITYGFKGPNHNVINHAVGGMQALIEAFHAIKSGQAERAVVVGYDVCVEPQAIFYYDKLGVLSHRHLRPFDKEHDGTVLAEGSAALVLESEASVMARSAPCYGEILAGIATSEANGLFSLEANGEHFSSLISSTLKQANIDQNDIGIIIAHGNGNPKSDISEARAINAIFSDTHTPVTAFKWATGHTVCASGVLDVVLASSVLRKQLIPGIANFEEPANACKGLNLTKDHRALEKGKHALVLNRGYASMNACLVIKPCD
jgi:3-oxoacyl-[acyl-carrier-protein] synthase-1